MRKWGVVLAGLSLFAVGGVVGGDGVDVGESGERRRGRAAAGEPGRKEEGEQRAAHGADYSGFGRRIRGRKCDLPARSRRRCL